MSKRKPLPIKAQTDLIGIVSLLADAKRLVRKLVRSRYLSEEDSDTAAELQGLIGASLVLLKDSQAADEDGNHNGNGNGNAN